MRRSLRIRKEPKFEQIIAVSAAFHILLIFAVTIPIKSKERDFKSYSVNLVAPVEIQRPTKAPSRKRAEKSTKTTVKVKKRPRKRVRAKIKTKAPEKSGIRLKTAEKEKKTTDIINREIERLRAISALSKLKKKEDESRGKEDDSELAGAIEAIRKKKVVTVSKAVRTSNRPVTGPPATASNAYIALVQQEIWNEWIPPVFDYSGLEVVISFRIYTDGKVSAPEIEESSGNSIFDRSGVTAILKASPLSPPPIEMELGVRFH